MVKYGQNILANAQLQRGPLQQKSPPKKIKIKERRWFEISGVAEGFDNFACRSKTDHLVSNIPKVSPSVSRTLRFGAKRPTIPKRSQPFRALGEYFAKSASLGPSIPQLLVPSSYARWTLRHRLHLLEQSRPPPNLSQIPHF
jgi:hypothetical protein